MTRLLIADDEPLLRFHLQKSLAEVWPEAEVVAQAANGTEAIQLIEALEPAVAFLDIHMPGQSGLEVGLTCSLKTPSPLVVFLTAYDEHAIKAFEQGAIDYLLKPLDEQRLATTVSRLQQRLKQSTQSPALDTGLIAHLLEQKDNQRLRWLKAQKGSQVKLLPVENIAAFKAEDKYTTILCEGDEYLVRLSIKELEARLDSSHFCRIHRSSLVNLSRVDRVERDDHGQMRLFIKGIALPFAVARAKHALFKPD